MTGHVVSFTPAGAPTRAVCSSCGELKLGAGETLRSRAEAHAWAYAPHSSIQFAGLPPVERAS